MFRSSRTGGALPRAGAAVGVLAMIGALLGGCDSEPDTSEPLPDAGSVLTTAADTSEEVTSGRFRLQVNGKLPEVGVHSAQGALSSAEGGTIKAKGTATMEQMGQLVELQFVLIEPSVYIKGPTGGFSQAPASMVTSVYDPSVLLDDERGIAHVLRTVQQPRTEGRETVNGVDTLRVGGTLAQRDVAPLIPGVRSDVEVKFWLREEPSRAPVRAWFQLPPRTEGAGPNRVEVQLSQLDEPVTITAPE